MSTPCWVLGGSGMLGTALRQALLTQGRALFTPSECIPWMQPNELPCQMARALEHFGQFVDAHGGDTNCAWEIVWAAGVGNFRSTTEEMQPELLGFKSLLEALTSSPVLANRRGSICLASSAGALYAGCTDWIIDESSTVSPHSPYGEAKLLLEKALNQYLAAQYARQGNGHFGEHVGLIARLSTLYGANQSAGKAQGLLSHMARCIVRGKPIHIFIPFDTIRDYLAVDDAAFRLSCMFEHCAGSGPAARVRIVASEVPTTVTEIVMAFRRLAHRAPRIIVSRADVSALYARIVQYKSRFPSDPATASRTPLLLGIAQLLEAERRRYVQS